MTQTVQETGDRNSEPETTSPDTVFNPGPRTYESELVPRIFAPWARRLVDAAELMPGERVLDLACGTGIVARTASPRLGPGGQVVGVDINPAMLEVARDLSRQLRTPIEFLEAGAGSLPVPDSSIDAVLCQQGLQFFPDRVGALQEVRRVLTPRGRAIFAVWRGPEFHTNLLDLDAKVLGRHLGPEVMEGSDAPFWLGDTDELRELFRSAGFGSVHVRTHVSEIRFGSTREMVDGLCGAHAPAAEAIARLTPRQQQTMYREVAEAFAPFTDDDGVMFTMTSNVVKAAV